MKEETASVLRILGINVLTATLAAALLDSSKLKSKAVAGGLVVGAGLTLLSIGMDADVKKEGGNALARAGRTPVTLQ